MNQKLSKKMIYFVAIILFLFVNACTSVNQKEQTPPQEIQPQSTAEFSDKIPLNKIVSIQKIIGTNYNRIEQDLDDESLIELFRDYKCGENTPIVFYSPLPDQSTTQVKIKTVDDLINNGWRYLSDDYLSLVAPLDWENSVVDSRSWNRALHSWAPIDTLLRYLSQTQKIDDPYYENVLHFSLSFVFDWIDHYADFNKSYPGAASFAWYDMNPRARLQILAFLINLSACDPSVSNTDLLKLIVTAENHLLYSMDEKNFTPHSNHGYYQSKGMLYFCHDVPELVKCDMAKPLAEERIITYLTSFFTQEGVHKEHSPNYHAYMVGEIEYLILDGYLSSRANEQLLQLDQKAQVALAWMIAPDNNFVGFGDTDRKEENSDGSKAAIKLNSMLPEDYKNRSPMLDYYMNCASGLPNEVEFQNELLIGNYAQSGYAFIKVPNSSDSDCNLDTYLALTATFYSRTHKHADDLSFDWYEKGIPILLDSGRYGYEGSTPEKALADLGFWYSDSKRIYVESTHAHNTVEIDGTTDSRKNVPFYGSGVQKVYKNEEGLFIVKGEITRKEGFIHDRTIILNPQKWVLVLDDIQAPKENVGNQHNYTQWFHFNPAADIQLVNNSLTGTVDSLPLQIVSLSAQQVTAVAVKGQVDPRMQGWISFQYLQLIPNWAIGMTISDQSAHFATLLSISEGSIQPITSPELTSEDGNRVYSWENLNSGVIETIKMNQLNETINYLVSHNQ